ncbi:MAG: acyltransferase [Prevotella sp.]|nr:acyltransferase [Prevotella sp.]
MKPIELFDFSRYRSALMGAAMLFVMFFHVGMPKSELMYGVVRCGNIGVDMFLFLSGIGLWYAWTKNPQLRHFYWRRYVRIYPAWILMAALFYIPNFIEFGVKSYSPDVPNLVANILVNWSFWRVDDLTFWFIPAIMMMYTFAPFYMKLIIRWPSYRWLPVLFMVWAVMVQYYPPVHSSVGHVEIFWSRIPVFLIGINCGAWVKGQRTMEGQAIWWILILFVLSFAMCIEFENHWRGHFPLFLERMVYIPCSISGMLLLCRLFRHSPAWLLRFLTFVGGISLELYLIHIQFVYKYIRPYNLGYCLTVLLMIAISIPLAWLLSKLVDFVVRLLPKEI